MEVGAGKIYVSTHTNIANIIVMTASRKENNNFKLK